METEETILLNYFLNSELQDNITLQQFIKKFPPAYSSNPQIKTLYKEYHDQRSENRKLVKKNTVEECKKSDQWNNEDDDDRLTLDQANKLLSTEEKNMLHEINFMKHECKKWIQDIQRINGNMSDLRYGKILPEVIREEEIINELKSQSHYIEIQGIPSPTIEENSLTLTVFLARFTTIATYSLITFFTALINKLIKKLTISNEI
ncbi:2763_t:CDS:2 [Diversispora eburnea]|uniref:2763_t:CDS:1 n=1 Tax=Diversispora eburnea TaxID=1213867 RepID=A0A9N8YR72_9GLOM|nr:2763_t:CDS:2 [Diversispora eburnea]